MTTTTVDLVIRLRVAGAPADVATYLDPLYCLADVVAVQARGGTLVAGLAPGRSRRRPEPLRRGHRGRPRAGRAHRGSGAHQQGGAQ